MTTNPQPQVEARHRSVADEIVGFINWAESPESDGLGYAIDDLALYVAQFEAAHMPEIARLEARVAELEAALEALVDEAIDVWGVDEDYPDIVTIRQALGKEPDHAG